MTDEPPRDCSDCHVKPGSLHVEGCDMERCAHCGGQRISCGCGELDDEEGSPDPAFDEDKYPRLPWTGLYPGTDACVELGWYCKWVEGHGWRKCDKDDPEAGPDLNRLQVSANWDPAKAKWVSP